MNKSKYIIVAAILGIVCLVWLGLTSPKLMAGDVIKKHYERESNTLLMMPVIMSTGKTTKTMMIPYWIYDDADWVITIGGEREDGEYVTRCLYVSETEYNSISVGDFISVDGHQTEDPDRKTRKD